MLSFIRRQMSTTNLLVVAALIFAMAGGAFAATGGKHRGHAAGHHGHASKKGKGKKGKATGKRGPRGKQGPEGKEGPAGPQGPQGPQGVAGANGKDGASGANGVNGESVTITAEGECTKFSNASGEGKACAGKAGEAGKSVEAFPIAKGESECEEQGGVVYEVEESGQPVAICNGSPWTVGTLPPGKTETGEWAVGTETAENPEVLAPVSFAVPLASASGVTVHFINTAEEAESFSEGTGSKPAGCPGTAASPTALPGNLCVYEAGRSGVYEETKPGKKAFSFEYTRGTVQTTGSVLAFYSETGGNAFGSYAVTAPTP